MICVAFGSISLIINLILKLIPIANSEHGDEHEDEKGIGNEEADLRKSTKAIQLKRSQKRI